ncbi:MAG: YbhB/YbcL family Raf kinase inhibitor-like protein [Acidimicrobiia bacterium]
MELWSNSFSDGDPIPGEFAFGLPDEASHMVFGPNLNPHLAWSGVPDGTRSLAVVVYDRDVPTRPDDVNQEGREVPPDLPRADFFHWLLIDLPPRWTGIEAGSFADGVVPHGKNAAGTPGEVRQGLNDYTSWFAGDPDMSGDYFGYDGPCPPWNDSLVHHYEFTLFALGTDRLDVPRGFRGQDARDAMAGHVLASSSFTGTYTLNPRLL